MDGVIWHNFTAEIHQRVAVGSLHPYVSVVHFNRSLVEGWRGEECGARGEIEGKW